jgi:hypothetical protein
VPLVVTGELPTVISVEEIPTLVTVPVLVPGVNPNAVVTSRDDKVTAPVLVLNDVTAAALVKIGAPLKVNVFVPSTVNARSAELAALRHTTWSRFDRRRTPVADGLAVSVLNHSALIPAAGPKSSSPVSGKNPPLRERMLLVIAAAH